MIPKSSSIIQCQVKSLKSKHCNRQTVLSTKQKRAHGSDNVFEAVSAITGQPFASAAATEFLAMRSLEINMSLLLRARTTSLGTDLKK